MTFSTDVKTNCVLWLSQKNSPTKVQRMFRAKYGKHEVTPSRTQIRKWSENFKTCGSIKKDHKRKLTVDQEKIVNSYEIDPKQSLRRASRNLEVSVSSVRNALKKAHFRVYRPRLVQALKVSDHEARVKFAEGIARKIEENPCFLNLVFFSDEAIFHLEGGVNRQNSTHWSMSNPNWLVQQSLNSPKVMVWAAVGGPGVIGPFFFDGNVDNDSYLKLLEEDFYPAFSSYTNQSDLLLMQDGAPPHWAQRVATSLDRERRSTRLKHAMASKITGHHPHGLFCLGLYQEQGIHKELSKSGGFEDSNHFSFSANHG